MLVNVYDSGNIQGFFATDGFFGLNLQINLPKGRNTKSWKQQKKLLFGQLLIFSDDQFENCIYFGVIRKADREEMDYTS